MPVYDIHVGRIDGHGASGMIYSFQPIAASNHGGWRVMQRFVMKVQGPQGYDLHQVLLQPMNPNGDQPTAQEPMVFDPEETQKGGAGGGNVYMRAARVVERMRSGSEFARVG